MKKIVAGANDAGQRLDKLLSKLCHSAPKSLIYKWIRKKRVKINGKKADGAYFVCEGDVLELYINDEFFEDKTEIPPFLTAAADLEIAYEDENILVLKKPSGLTAHSPIEGGGDCLLNRVLAYLYQKGEYSPQKESVFRPALCNRIDRNTSGLVIAAKNAAALRGINEKIRSREIRKLYLLRTVSPVSPKEGVIRGFIIKDEAKRRVYFSEKAVSGGVRAETKYRSLGGTLVEAELLTGRTHQIRASFAYLGYPLEGDVKYGAPKNQKSSYQALCAYKIIFDFSSPAGCLEYLRGKEITVSGDF